MSKEEDVREKIMLKYLQNPNSNYNSIAKSLQIHPYIVSRVIQRYSMLFNGFHSFKAQKRPNRSEAQQKSARTRGRKLYDNFISKNFCIIEDDETCIKYDHQQIPGAVYYIAKYRGKADKKFKYTKHDKFVKKALIWQAICSCGKKLAPYISQSTLSGQIYVK